MKRRFRLLSLILPWLLVPGAFAQTGWIQITASHIQNANGSSGLLATGTLCAQPVDASNHPLAVQAGGSGGMILSTPACTTVTNGAISGFTLPDTSLTSPLNACFRITVKDANGIPQLPSTGYNCVQPTSVLTAGTTAATWCSSGLGVTTCNLDLFPPNVAAVAIVQTGPVGPTGPAGPTGPTGPAGSISTVTPTQPGQALVNGGTNLFNGAGFPIASGLTSTAIAQLFPGVDCYADSSPNGSGACLSLRENLKSAGHFSTVTAYTPSFVLGYSPKYSFAQIAPHNQGGHPLTLTSNTTGSRIRGGLDFYGEQEFGYCANGYAWSVHGVSGLCQNGYTDAAGGFGYWTSGLATDMQGSGAFTVVKFCRIAQDQYNSGGSVVTGGGVCVWKNHEWSIDLTNGCGVSPAGGSFTYQALGSLGTWGGYSVGATGTHMITLYYSPNARGTGLPGFTCTWDANAEASPTTLASAITPSGSTYLQVGYGMIGASDGGPFFMWGHLSASARAQMWNNRAVQHPPLWNDVGPYSVSNAGKVSTTWPTYYFVPATSATSGGDWNDDEWNFVYTRTYTNGGDGANLTGAMHSANANVQVQTNSCYLIFSSMPGATAGIAPTVGAGGGLNLAFRVDGHILQSGGIGGALDFAYTGSSPLVSEVALPCDGNTHTVTAYQGFAVGAFPTGYNPSQLYSLLGGLNFNAVSYQPGSSFALTHLTSSGAAVTGTVFIDGDSIPSGNQEINSAIDSWPQQLLQNASTNPFSGTNDIAVGGFGSKLSTTDCPQASGSTAMSTACTTWMNAVLSEFPLLKTWYSQAGVNDFGHGAGLSAPSCLGEAMAALSNKINYFKTLVPTGTFYVQTLGNATLATNDGCTNTSNPAITITAGSNGSGSVSITAGASTPATWRTQQNAICALYSYCKTIDASGGGLNAGGLTQVTATCTTSNLATDICWPAPSDGCMASDALHLNTCGATHFATAIVKTITGSTVVAGTNN